MTDPVVEAINREVDAAGDDIIEFLREIVRIPSYDSQIRRCRRGGSQTHAWPDFDEVRFDDMGNVLGRAGTGPTTIVFDSHIDTVGIGDPAIWEWDPLEGKVEDGILFARGAGDEKASTPPMVYAIAI